MHNKNKKSPRTDPWVTPQFIAERPDSYPFIDTHWLSLERYDLNQSFEALQIP